MLWFWLWLLFVAVLLLVPLGWGWGSRGWGPPYPSYYRHRRRAARPQPSRGQPTGSTVPDGSGWGALDNMLWLFAGVALLWLLVGLTVG